jgi:hypothetical protein
MKQTIRLLMIALALFGPVVLSITTSGCKTAPPTADSGYIAGDPVVVNAEKTIAISFDAIDRFLAWERVNRATAGPEVKAAADRIRKEAPDAFRTARAVLRAYKENRSPEQGALLNEWLAALSTLAARATVHFPN